MTNVKYCHGCSKDAVFYRNKTRKDGLATQCKLCSSTASKKWQKANRERHVATVQRHHTRNPDLRAAQQGKQAAMKRNGHVYDCIPDDFDIHATTPFYAEARRLTRETGIKHDVDHIQPIHAFGMHTPDNLQVLTASENRGH